MLQILKINSYYENLYQVQPRYNYVLKWNEKIKNKNCIIIS